MGTTEGIYDPSTFSLRVTSTVLRFLGIVITAWRVYFRLKIGRFWWEDCWAGIALIACVASSVGEWMYLLTHDLSAIVGFWFYKLGSNSVICATYLSIVFSIIRILPPSRIRRFACLFALCFGIVSIVSLCEEIWPCVADPSWHRQQPPICFLSLGFVIFEYVWDCVTVAALVGIPLRVLWRVKLPRRQRRMILLAFASNVILAFVAVFHIAACALMVDILIVAGSDFQTACSIIICNLLVVVTYAYRFLWKDGDGSTATTSDMPDSDDFTLPRERARRPDTLTTVEIGGWTATEASGRFRDRSTLTR